MENKVGKLKPNNIIDQIPKFKCKYGDLPREYENFIKNKMLESENNKFILRLARVGSRS
ncbi:hypothetical protein [Paraclostridium bifermentans]|uniref:hypothetical protein n=1 Tax=Paraclostridium bifermentans TaxID=1490 RepID=UPI00374F897D